MPLCSSQLNLTTEWTNTVFTHSLCTCIKVTLLENNISLYPFGRWANLILVLLCTSKSIQIIVICYITTVVNSITKLISEWQNFVAVDKQLKPLFSHSKKERGVEDNYNEWEYRECYALPSFLMMWVYWRGTNPLKLHWGLICSNKQGPLKSPSFMNTC